MKLALALALCLAACGSAQTTAPAKPDVQADVRAAEDAERARRHDIARAKYEQAVADARDPQSAGFANFRFGETLATWGEYAEALRHLERATAATPGEASAWYDLGIVRAHEGAAGAVAALERAKSLAPTDWRPRVALGALHWKLAAHCYRGADRADRAEPASDACAPEVAAASAEYRGLLALDLPERLRAKVEWALGELAKPRADVRPALPSDVEPPAPAPSP